MHLIHRLDWIGFCFCFSLIASMYSVLYYGIYCIILVLTFPCSHVRKKEKKRKGRHFPYDISFNIISSEYCIAWIG